MLRWSRLLAQLGIPETALSDVVTDLADLLKVRMPEAVSDALTRTMEVAE